MAEYFAGGHLRFINGEWRDDNGDAIEISRVRHGRWLSWDELHGGNTLAKNVLGVFCSECIRQSDSKTNFCHNCGAKMDGGNGNSDMA